MALVVVGWLVRLDAVLPHGCSIRSRECSKVTTLHADPTPCEDCGEPIRVVWAANNDLFNDVTGTVGVGMFCIPCFDAKLREGGIVCLWSPLDIAAVPPDPRVELAS